MIKELNLNPDNGTDVIMVAYIECGAVEIDKLPRGVACQGAGDGRPRRGRNWDRKILYRKKYFHECRLSAELHVVPDDNHKVRSQDLLATMTVLESLSSRKGMSPPVTRQVYSPEADMEAAPSSSRLEDSGETS